VAIAHVEVILPQSEANSGDQAFLADALVQIPRLSRLNCTHRLSGGFSDCKVYVAFPVLDGQVASRPWIVKVGPLSEIQAEDAGLTVAKGHIPPSNIASKIALVSKDDRGALILDYANYQGRPPIDLESVLAHLESAEAVTALVSVMINWQSAPSFQRTNISQLFKDWTVPKLPHLPETIRQLVSFPVVYSPDFGEAYSNPAYYITRDLKHTDIALPTSFTHGDLNLRNVLFSRSTDGTVDTKTPVLIDFRHAGGLQTSFVDLAKLEACLRYTVRRQIDTSDSLYQSVAFLSGTRTSLQPATLPDVCSDKTLQDLWRCIRSVRAHTVELLRSGSDAQPGYWLTLAAYAFSAATYPQLSQPQRHLAYLESAALFTHFLRDRDPQGEQGALPVHAAFSPTLVTRPVQPGTASHISLLATSIARNRAILIIGPGYGRTSGVEPFTAFLARLYKALTSIDAPIASAGILLEAIQRKRPRQDVLRGIADHTARWHDDIDRCFANAPWTLVLNWHLHDLPQRALTASGRPEPIRIDTLADAVAATDAIAAGASAYFPLFGDPQSRPDTLVLTGLDRRERDRSLGAVARALDQRQAPLSIVFWRCDELDVEEVIRLRDDLRSHMSVTADSYYLTDVDNDARDAALRTLDIVRLSMRMPELLERYKGLDQAVPSIPSPGGHFLPGSAGDVWVPDARQRTRGLLTYVSEGLEALSDPSTDTSGIDFLLGGRATPADIADGRVVKRGYIDNTILPAVRAAVEDRNRDLRAIALVGRAGCGISTLLFHAATLISADFPVLLANTRLSRGREEWKEAGALIGEISRATGQPVVVVGEASDALIERYSQLMEAASEAGARVVLLVGGRKDTLLNRADAGPQKLLIQSIVIEDALSSTEWEALARVLQRTGLARVGDPLALASRMKSVGRLLPAIFEATDRKNRKFREIISYEYERYSRDSIVQMAYRLICAFGAFDLPLTQFWLVKALGNRGLTEVLRIISALSDDIISERDRLTDLNDVLLSPTHRIIAEEVIHVATPGLAERLRDIELLLSSANLASQGQGLAVASLLYSRGPLAKLIEDQAGSQRERTERLTQLYEMALGNTPLHPQVEIHIRQHFSLSLRRWEQYERALSEIELARSLEPDNSATLHIAGLIHESRAINAWRRYTADWREEGLLKARGEERDALEFFREVREAKPMQEHGYESEARYYKRKRQIAIDSAHPAPAFADETKSQLFHGLTLLRTAEMRVPRAQLKETPKTKAFVTGLMGDLTGALSQLQGQLSNAKDPVKRMRLARAAASVAAEAQNWTTAISLYEKLLSWGERDAGLYLDRDLALEFAGKTTKERATALKASAEEFNRSDVETQVRWAILSLGEGFIRRAIEALRRADDVARFSMNVLQRDSIYGTVEEDAKPKAYRGRISRMTREGEGFLIPDVASDEVFFRSSPGERGRLKPGDKVTFHLAVRIRGLRAIDVHRLDPAS
jgi:cold shock CspA family protein